MGREDMERMLTKYARVERTDLLYKNDTELRSMLEKVRRRLVVPDTQQQLVPVTLD